MSKIKIFCAGVAGKLAHMSVERFTRENPDVACELQIGGSTAGVNKLLAGEHFDVMILADNSNIDQFMMPAYADGYFIWGGNEMVVMGNDVTSANWKEKLLDPSSVIKHRNPYDDPGGYRAVMAMKLADKVEPGLSEKLFNAPGYNGLERDQYAHKPHGHGNFPKDPGEAERKGPPPLPDGQYEIVYRSMPVSMGRNFAELPPEMNLSNPEYENIYNEAEFEVDGGGTVRGNVIYHAIVIPTNAENKEGAEAFAKVFLSNNFMMQGFTPVEKPVGSWNIKRPNMWDNAARGYSLMTLMEVNGTNKQLDCIPLEPDMVVLDCGCGPGRVAIQAAKRVKKVICLDSSEGMLDACRKNCEAAGITNVEFVFADWQLTEIGKTIPEVDVVIQSRGGGGPSTLEMLQKAARKMAVNIMWAKGAPNLPESRGKLFVDCYSEEDMERIPGLRPFRRDGKKPLGPPPGMPSFKGKLPMGSDGLKAELEPKGIEVHTTTIEEGWDKLFASREEAYADLINLSDHPELVNMEQFRKNVDKFLTEREDGFYFFLPTQTDVTWFRTR